MVEIDPTPRWWALALSEQVTGKKPLAVRCGEEEVVLFRDADGVARALEDRCPHRRVPLSLGKITPGGQMQCGYHGWTYDGATGKCVAIPNLHDDEKVPERYRAETRGVTECDGFVYVWIGSPQASATPPPHSLYTPGGLPEHRGSVTLPLSHDAFVAALFDGPWVLLDFATSRVTDFLLGDPEMSDGRLMLERGATWGGPHLPDRFVPEWPLVLRVTVEPITGETLVEMLDTNERLISAAEVSPVPAARGTTAVIWRSYAADYGGPAGVATRGLSIAGRPAISVRRFVNGRKLASLRVAPSHIWRTTLRAARDNAPAQRDAAA